MIAWWLYVILLSKFVVILFVLKQYSSNGYKVEDEEKVRVPLVSYKLRLKSVCNVQVDVHAHANEKAR